MFNTQVIVVILASVCLAQGSVVPRNLTEDIEAAIVSTNQVTLDCQSLGHHEQQMYHVIADDAFAIMQAIIDKCASYGVAQETLDLFLTNLSLAHLSIQTTIYNQMFLLGDILDLLSTILSDLQDDWMSLDTDLELLQSAHVVHNNYFLNATMEVDIQLHIVENMLNDIVETLTAEQAAEIQVDMGLAQSLIDAQFLAVKEAQSKVDLGMGDLSEQLVNINDQLPPELPSDTRSSK